MDSRGGCAYSGGRGKVEALARGNDGVAWAISVKARRLVDVAFLDDGPGLFLDQSCFFFDSSRLLGGGSDHKDRGSSKRFTTHWVGLGFGLHVPLRRTVVAFPFLEARATFYRASQFQLQDLRGNSEKVTHPVLVSILVSYLVVYSVVYLVSYFVSYFVSYLVT